MKIGDKLLSKGVFLSREYFTKDKYYEINDIKKEINKTVFYIKCDNGQKIRFFEEILFNSFYTLSEIRTMKLNKIKINQHD